VFSVTNGIGAPARPRLLEPDQLLDRGASLAAVFLRPADAEPAVAAHLADQLLVQRAGLESVQLRAQLGSDQLGEVGAQLGAQRLLLRVVIDVHEGGPNLVERPSKIAARGASTIARREGPSHPVVIGWTEYVDLPDWGVRRSRAKVDTGALSSALHVENIRELPRGTCSSTW
jgi:hypothetical protein